MEEYVEDGLAASVDRVVPGLGRLAVMLAGLAGELAGPGRAAMTLDAMEQLVIVQGRELLRAVLQHGLDARAAAEPRLPQVTGSDGIARRRAERGHGRAIVTVLGAVRVRRIAYRAGVAAVPALFPQDAVLSLPPREYSWQLQQLAVMFTRSGAYEQAQELIQAATGIRIGKKQLEQITAEAAAGAPGFYPALALQHEQGQPEPDREPVREEQELMPLGLSADGKGVAMRPDSRRERTRAPGKRVRTFAKRRGTGEKGHKRMAETGAVFDVTPVPRGPRSRSWPPPRPAARPRTGRAP